MSNTRAAKRAAKNLRKDGKPEPASRVEQATFHTLRHTFASWSIPAGIPIAEVQQSLGHSSDPMTRRYAHLQKRAEERRRSLERLTEVGRFMADGLAVQGAAL